MEQSNLDSVGYAYTSFPLTIDKMKQNRRTPFSKERMARSLLTRAKSPANRPF